MHKHFFTCTHVSKLVRLHQKIALFLDFDGTLVPLQKDPALCFPTTQLKQELRSLAGSPNCYLAIISGRSVSDLRDRIGIRKIYYGGNHGIDIRGPGMRYMPSEALPMKSTLQTVKHLLKKELAGIPGAWLEDKTLGLTVHCRSVVKENIPALKKIFFKTTAPFLNEKLLMVIKGKKVYELVPYVAWNKGEAALWMLKQFEMKCLPIYVGDDLTDETAFSALSCRGLTIRIGKSGKTSAHYYLKNHHEVLPFLQQIQKFSGNCSC